MTWARQLFSTKLAWDERATQLHAVNSIEEAFCASVVAYAAKLSLNSSFSGFALCTKKLRGYNGVAAVHVSVLGQEMVIKTSDHLGGCR